MAEAATERMAAPESADGTEQAAGTEPASVEAAERIRRLRDFAADIPTLPILVQSEPDPDAIGSAFAVRLLLDRNEKSAPIVSLGQSRRPETKRMLELLELQVVEIAKSELSAFERIVTVDMQPTLLAGGGVRLAVIDHHPVEQGYDAEFVDIRPAMGAAATMLTEYLRAAGHDVGERLATALLYGIRTDTALLTRGCTRDDVEAYAWLQERADLALLNIIDRPAYPRDALPAIGRAIGCPQLRGDLAVLWLGAVRKNRAHLMSELADLSLNIEGVRWVAAAGVIEKSLVLNIRYLADADPGAGSLARHLAKSAGGSGGGHATMARVEIPLTDVPFELEDEPTSEGGDRASQVAHANAMRIADWIMSALNSVRSTGGPDRG